MSRRLTRKWWWEPYERPGRTGEVAEMTVKRPPRETAIGRCIPDGDADDEAVPYDPDRARDYMIADETGAF
ncbi:hypothetical protein IU469_22075 [Nocardia puris]|uniref:hypothetical protein n=1 Tax=Nocardia puris TaxID=208602 RepID=UPI0018948A7D|nr:hypothetical protein [Nocardia puris]MBF6368387.1 hypothetical protein [Nocardia puris]